MGIDEEIHYEYREVVVVGLVFWQKEIKTSEVVKFVVHLKDCRTQGSSSASMEKMIDDEDCWHTCLQTPTYKQWLPDWRNLWQERLGGQPVNMAMMEIMGMVNLMMRPMIAMTTYLTVLAMCNFRSHEPNCATESTVITMVRIRIVCDNHGDSFNAGWGGCWMLTWQHPTYVYSHSPCVW